MFTISKEQKMDQKSEIKIKREKLKFKKHNKK